MRRSYISSLPWHLHGIVAQPYFTLFSDMNHVFYGYEAEVTTTSMDSMENHPQITQ
jgi:hypothetical protein